MGKLSKSTRFSTKGVNWTVIIVICSILATLIFAIVLGNILGDKAQQSQNTTTTGDGSSSIIPPTLDKTPPHSNLHAYFADMTGADPAESLSAQTSSARDAGNALYFDLRASDGTLIYSSAQAESLGYSCRDNLTLDRLTNHLAYYNDYAVALFKSDLSATQSNEKRLTVQTNESLLLAEATKSTFSQVVIEFSGAITKKNAPHYYAYLMNVKLSCGGTPVGIKLPYTFVADPDNAGIIAELLGIVDFLAADLEGRSAAEIDESLSSLVYFVQRYSTVVMLDAGDAATLSDRLSALENRGIKSYIVK